MPDLAIDWMESGASESPVHESAQIQSQTAHASATYDAVPSGVVLAVELLLDVRSNVSLKAELALDVQ